MVRLRMETQVPCHWLFKAHVSSLQQIGEAWRILRHEIWFVGGAWWGFVGFVHQKESWNGCTSVPL